MLLDGATDTVAVPKGSLGFRYGDDGVGKWNLELGDLMPELTVARSGGETAEVHLPRFDTVDGHGDTLTRGVPVRRVGEHLVCTVFDLMLAQYGCPARGCPVPGPPATTTPPSRTPRPGKSRSRGLHTQAIRIAAKRIARNAEESGGRSMIIMGAGICQWFHGDATYRAVLALLLLTGSMGRNGGGWAHYVGQEKCRPVTGWTAMAMGTDWSRPPRQMAAPRTGTPHRPVALRRLPRRRAGQPTGPRPVCRQAHHGRAGLGGGDGLDPVLSAVRPVQPRRRRRALAADREVPDYVASQLAAGELKLAVTDPDNPRNWPRVLDIWRANLLGSQAKVMSTSCVICWAPRRTCRLSPPRKSCGPTASHGPTIFPRGRSTC